MLFNSPVRYAGAAVAALLFLFAIACGSSSPSAPSAGPSANVTVAIQGDRANQSYAPSPVTMRAGQTIAWQNADSTAHTATQDSAGFNSGTINAGATSAPVTMGTAGTFTYHCSIHPGMIGTITVQ